MTNSKLNEVIQRVEELDGKATTAPWHWEGGYLNWLQPFVISASHDGGFCSRVEIKKADADFIAFSRTALPKMAAALKLAMEAIYCHCVPEYYIDPCEGCSKKQDIESIFNDGNDAGDGGEG